MTEAQQQRIRLLLEAGTLRKDIAREIGVSPSTITRWARILGFPDRGNRPSATDWAAVQAHYDAGHTIDECKAKFGFEYGSWEKAVTRGDLIPRTRSNGELGLATRDAIENLLSRGLRQADVARELGLSKSTVAFHVRKLGKRADPRFARRYEWSEIQRAIDDEGLSIKQARARFGFSRASQGEPLRAVRDNSLARPAARDAASSQKWDWTRQPPRKPRVPLRQLPFANRELGRQERTPQGVRSEIRIRGLRNRAEVRLC